MRIGLREGDLRTSGSEHAEHGDEPDDAGGEPETRHEATPRGQRLLTAAGTSWRNRPTCTLTARAPAA